MMDRQRRLKEANRLKQDGARRPELDRATRGL